MRWYWAGSWRPPVCRSRSGGWRRNDCQHPHPSRRATAGENDLKWEWRAKIQTVLVLVDTNDGDWTESLTFLKLAPKWHGGSRKLETKPRFLVTRFVDCAACLAGCLFEPWHDVSCLMQNWFGVQLAFSFRWSRCEVLAFRVSVVMGGQISVPQDYTDI